MSEDRSKIILAMIIGEKRVILTPDGLKEPLQKKKRCNINHTEKVTVTIGKQEITGNFIELQEALVKKQ